MHQRSDGIGTHRRSPLFQCSRSGGCRLVDHYYRNCANFILKGKVQEHRQWITRSFAIALVFLEVRVIGGLTGWDTVDVHATETIVWFCLAFAILSADPVLQFQGFSSSTCNFGFFNLQHLCLSVFICGSARLLLCLAARFERLTLNSQLRSMPTPR